MTDSRTEEEAGNEKSGRHSIMHLGADCTIREAGALKKELLAHLEEPGPLFIDGSAVERVDTAGVQLLVAFSLDCMERGIAFGWPGRSPTLERAIATLGVAPLLECPGEVALPDATPTTAG